MTKDDTITLPRSVVEQALECLEDNISYDFNGNPYEESDWLMQAAAINLSAALDQPQSKHEPVSWIENFGGSFSYGPIHEAARKLPEGVRFDLYTRPYPRQPLTDEQIDNIADGMPGGIEGFMKGWGWRQFARAVEANRIRGDA